MINWCADWLDLLLYHRSTLYCVRNVETANHNDTMNGWTIICLIDQYARRYRSYGYLHIRKTTLMHSLHYWHDPMTTTVSIEINHLPQHTEQLGKRVVFYYFHQFLLLSVYTLYIIVSQLNVMTELYSLKIKHHKENFSLLSQWLVPNSSMT